MADADESNCAFQDVDARTVSTFQSAGSPPSEALADSIDITVPMLVNTKALAKGDELVVQWATAKRVAKKTQAPATWASQARTKGGKQQRRS